VTHDYNGSARVGPWNPAKSSAILPTSGGRGKRMETSEQARTGPISS
jgi:hypothetical protein